MIVWRGTDPAGHDACRIFPHALEGMAVLAQPPSALAYRVVCDSAWRTHSVALSGWIASREINLSLRVEAGQWFLNDVEQPQVEGCLDVDLNFTPSTNTLPIRRLGLAVGESATISVAWLRFPELTLERLAQTYRRTAERVWEYASDDFSARMEVDEEGLVTTYGELWVRA